MSKRTVLFTVVSCVFMVVFVLGFYTGCSDDNSTNASPVDESSKIDDVYRRFCMTYDSMDSGMFREVYTDDCLYLHRSVRNIMKGDAALSFLGKSVEEGKKNGHKYGMEFRIVSRETDGSLAVDTGYYKFTVTEGDVVTYTDYGKYYMTMRKMDDGRWKVSIDSDTPANKQSFDGAECISIISARY